MELGAQFHLDGHNDILVRWTIELISIRSSLARFRVHGGQWQHPKCAQFYTRMRQQPGNHLTREWPRTQGPKLSCSNLRTVPHIFRMKLQESTEEENSFPSTDRPECPLSSASHVSFESASPFHSQQSGGKGHDGTPSKVSIPNELQHRLQAGLRSQPKEWFSSASLNGQHEEEGVWA